MTRKRERRIDVFKKFQKLSKKEYRSLLDLVSFALMMHPISLTFDSFLRYAAQNGATKEERLKFKDLIKETEDELYKKIAASGCWRYLRNYGSDFVIHLLDLYPYNYKGISHSKLMDIIFPGKSS